MKLKEGFITHTVGGEQFMVAAGPAEQDFHGLVRSNETAAFIVDQLKTDTTEEQIVMAMCAQYDADPETVRRDVSRIIAQLRAIHAVE